MILNEWLVQRDLIHRLNEKWMLTNFTPFDWWECDLFCLNRNMRWKEIEIKLSVADFKADQKKDRYHPDDDWAYGPQPPKQKKHELLSAGHEHCPNLFYYCMPNEIVEKVEIPEYAGLMTFDYSDDSMSYIKIIKRAPKLHDNKMDKTIFGQLSLSATNRYLRLKYYDNQVNIGI